jgi:Holliday junction DNA helicase RuvB
MGKTALAEGISREYSRTRTAAPSTFVRILAGPRITSLLVEKLGAIGNTEFLFVDEIHALDREAQELLHLALDERRTLGTRDGGGLDRGRTRSISEFTLIGASTEPGKLTTALRSRLHQIILDPYDLVELKAIAVQAASALGVELTPQGARHLAERSQRTPRSVERLLHELCVTRAGDKTIDRSAVRSFLDDAGIDERGLNRFQQQYVRILAAADGAVSLNVTRSRLGIDKHYIQSDIEPHLLQLGLIDVGPTGRTLTETGRAVADELARAAAASEHATPAESGPDDDAIADPTAAAS